MAEILAHPTWYAHVNLWGGDAVVVMRMTGESTFNVLLDLPSTIVPGQEVSERITWLDLFTDHADALAFATHEAQRRSLPVVDLPTVRGEL